MLPILFFALDASGSVPELPPSSEWDKLIETPMGPLSTKKVYSACIVEHPFVGTITNVHSYRHPETRRLIWTDVTFNVELDLKSSLGSSFTIRMFGGTIGDRTMTSSLDLPVPEVGRRYAVAATTMKFQPNRGPWMQGDPMFVHTQWVDPSLVLPTQSHAHSEFETFCGALP